MLFLILLLFLLLLLFCNISIEYIYIIFIFFPSHHWLRASGVLGQGESQHVSAQLQTGSNPRRPNQQIGSNWRSGESARTGYLTNRLKLSLAQTVEMCLELLYRSCRSPLPRRAPSGARCILDCRDGRAQGRGGPRFTPRYSGL